MSVQRAAIEDMIEATLDAHPHVNNRTKAFRIAEEVFGSEEGLRRLIDYLLSRGHRLA